MVKEKILVIQTAFLGDAVLTLPMIQKLNEVFPDSRIDVLCIPSTKEIFEASPFVNYIHVYDKRGSDKSIIKLFQLGKKLKQENYTRIYSPHRSFRTTFLVMLSEVRETFGFSNSSFSYVYKNVITYDSKAHEVKRNLNLLGSNTTSDEWKIIPKILLNETIVRTIDDFLAQYGSGKFAAVAPGSVWNTKIYPKEYYFEIISYLIKKSYTVFLIGGASDAVYCDEFIQSFNGLHGNIISTAGKFSILESIQLLKNCDLLISNDSAPTHLGMCADIPVVTIYCSTIPDFGFYPYNEKSTYLSYDDLKCKPCGIHGHKKCPIETFECAHKLDMNLIFNSIEKIITMYEDRKF